MSSPKISRRRLLQIAGIAAGVALSAQHSLQTSAEATNLQDTPIELWLLQTGKDQIDPNIYKELLKSVGGQPSVGS
jgi:hypothetical protein